MAESKKHNGLDVVVVGSCNTDFFFFTSAIPKTGETVVGRSLMTSFGGKGANQCVAAARLGASTALVARVGDDDFGQEYINYMRKENIDVSNVMKTKDHATGSAQITVADDGKNVIIINPGANAFLTAKDIKKVKSIIESAKVLVLQLEVPLETSLQALQFCKGISIMNATPATKENLTDLMKLPTIFVVNDVEAEQYTETSASSIEGAKQAVEKLLSKGCNSAVVTIGDQGCVYGDKDAPPKHYPTPKVTPVDNTGAGDAFVGAMAYMLSREPQQPMDKTFEVACAVGAACVTKPGAHGAFVDKTFLQRFDLP